MLCNCGIHSEDISTTEYQLAERKISCGFQTRCVSLFPSLDGVAGGGTFRPYHMGVCAEWGRPY
jgi:hypothetical protein